MKSKLPQWICAIAIVMLLSVSQTQAAVNPLQYGQPAFGTLDAGQHAEYTFDGVAGDKPVIAMNAHGGEMIPYVALYDPQGNLIGEDSGSGPKGNALLKGVVLAADGTYKIEAVNRAQGGSGKYGLMVSEETKRNFFDGQSPDTGVQQAYTLSRPWDHSNITYSLYNTLSQFDPRDVETVIAQAFQAWASVANLTFTEVQGNADINVQFGSIDGSFNILGETCPPYDPCGSGSVTLDSDEDWALYEPQGYNDISLLAVATHEFGHAIGLLHTDDPNALMYPEYSPYVLQPTQDDISGADRLYGAGSGTVSNPPSLPNNPPTSANQMQVSGELDDTHYTHFWDFDVVAGDTVTITMSASEGDLDSFLVLIDGNNNLLAFDDDSGGGKDAQLSNLKFPQTGTYTVAATRFAQAQGYTSGVYILGIEYDVGSGSNAPVATTAANVPSGQAASVNVSAPQTSQLDQLPSLDSILESPFANSAAPGQQERSGRVDSSQSYIWQQTWCASDADTLTDNLNSMDIHFAVNGDDVSANDVTQTDVSVNSLACRQYAVMLSDWTAGDVTLTSTLSLDEAVFDGQTIYPPGDYVYQYDIQAG